MARRTEYGALFETTKTVIELHNDIARQLNVIEATAGANQVLSNTGAGTAGRTGCNIAVDSNANDVQFDIAFFYQVNGQKYYKAIDAAVDISAECVGAGDTIATSGDGTLWMFVNTAGTVDGDTANGTAEDQASPILTLAQYSIASNTLPPGSDDVCVGCVQVTEGGSGAFTWGTGSITAEGETYYSFEGLPGIESQLASFALDAAAATFTYGAANIVLGSGVRVVATGKANAVFNTTAAVAVGKTGAYLLYVLANDVEACVALGSAYASLQAAKDAVRNHTPNPLMPLVGVIYVTARLVAFTPATTKLDVNGIDTEFVINGTGANKLEYGRSNGSQHTPIDDISMPSAGGIL